MEKFGGRTRTRTWDPLIKSQLLYQLSYAPGMPPRWTPQGLRPVAKRVPAVQRRTATDPVTPRFRSSPRKRGPRAADRVSGSRVSLRSPGTRSRGFPLEFTLAQAGAGMNGVCGRRLRLRRAGLRRKCTAAADFTTARREFHKRKAAGWGPGGSRTSAIVSGGWECDRRR